MSSEGISEDFDYTVSDSRGTRGVKDGQEYPIDPETWRKRHQNHKDTGCKECEFVRDKETILTFLANKEVRNSAGKNPVCLGKFTMPGWTGHASFYIFRCRSCEEICVDSPHGYRGEYMYLSCDSCRREIILNKKEHEQIYIADNLYVPRLISLKKPVISASLLAGFILITASLVWYF